MRRRFINNSLGKGYIIIEPLDGNIQFSLSNNSIEYSIDNGYSWIKLQARTLSPSLNVQKVFIRCTPTSISLTQGIGTFIIQGAYNLSGDIMGLLGKYKKIQPYSFIGLFSDSPVVNVASNFLPATILADHCYSSMFQGCTNLTTAPELPAITLANYCYSYMFQGCTNLTASPILPATALADSCYKYMFYGTNVLPDCSNIDFSSASVISTGGLKGLFAGTKVTDADLERILPKNSNGKYCLPATILADQCYSSMFQKCTSLTTAPELPAITLKSNCYGYMFYRCSQLNYIKAMFTTTPSYSYTNAWLDGVASTGTFVKNPDATWNVTGINGIPSGWSIQSAAQ